MKDAHAGETPHVRLSCLSGLFPVPFDLEIHIQYPFRAERLKPFGMKILAYGDGVQAVIAQLSV